MTSLTFAFVYLLYSTSRLRALDFYRLVVDEGAVLVKYHAWKSRANNLSRKTQAACVPSPGLLPV